jgi:spermidine synthase
MFALLPLLFVKEHHAALNIGIGTAGSLAVMGAFPFQRIDAVDLSSAIVDAAKVQFPHLNGRILEDPRVRVHIDDGRNFLLTTDARYDLVVIQLSSIWIGGTAELYNREFYEAARARMAPGGIFQQWVQLHHISTLDVARVVATLKAVFPHVTLWVAGHQGVLVASEAPLVADGPRLDTWQNDPSLSGVLKMARLPHAFAALGHLYLDDTDLAAFVDEVRLESGASAKDFISTDATVALEYSTPRGNLLTDAVATNMALLRRHASASILEHVSGVRDETTQRILLGYAAKERGFSRLADWVMKPVADSNQAGTHQPFVDFVRQTRGAKWP